MDYFQYKEQGDYLDAITSRYLKHKLCLALKITFKLKKRGEKYHTGSIVIDTSPLEYFRYLTIQDFHSDSLNVYTSRNINCHRYFETPLFLL